MIVRVDFITMAIVVGSGITDDCGVLVFMTDQDTTELPSCPSFGNYHVVLDKIIIVSTTAIDFF